jgi:tetratricopeptide (TPR) repeat protein
MAKKKRARRPAQPKSVQRSEILDRRALEGAIQQISARLPGAAPQDTPLARAQALMYQAFAEKDERRRHELARAALAISPDCADAYVLLAEQAPNRREALALYEKGVAAGARALGKEAFQRDVGHFWKLLPTRPYMRARLGLAQALWGAGRRDEAVAHLQDLLRLNPDDNQGVRYTLAGFLLFLDRDEELGQLLQQYADEESATWAFTQALLAFRQHGDTLEARRLLKKAKKANKYIPEYLLGRQSPPREQPPHYSPGHESEALVYISGFMAGWRFTPGAIAWVREHDEATKKRKNNTPHVKGPLQFIKKWLKERLPSSDDVWQADFRQLANAIPLTGESFRLWVVLVTNRGNELVLAHKVIEEAPAPALVWDTLVQAMQHPALGQPHRPRELQVRQRGEWEALRPHLEEIGVALSVQDQLDQWDAVYEGLSEHLGGKPQAGLLEVPGMKPEAVARFFDAAASFFEQAPWKKVGYEAVIKIDSGKFQSGPWYALLMGQSGLTIGLAVYDNLRLLETLWQRGADQEESARQATATTVLFGDAIDMPLADLEAIEKYGWKIARPDAYPAVFRKEPGLSMRPPLAWELELMEGCLRAIPAFVNRRKQDDPTEETIGALALTLSWVSAPASLDTPRG